MRSAMTGSSPAGAPAIKPASAKAAARVTRRAPRPQDLMGQAASDSIIGIADLKVARKGHTATKLSDGRILIVGGENESGQVKRAEVFDSGSRATTLAARLNVPRSDHSATLLGDGRLLVVGGRGKAGVRLQHGDDAVVVAESLGTLAPLQMAPVD